MRTVLTKLTSIETLLTQLVEITQAIEEQPLPAKRPRIDGSQSALGSMVQVNIFKHFFILIMRSCNEFQAIISYGAI